MSMYAGRLAAGELPLRARPPAREVRDAAADALLLSLADIVLDEAAQIATTQADNV